MLPILLLLLTAAVPFTDLFVDGTGRRGPAMIPVAPLTFAMGSLPHEWAWREAQRRHRVELSAYAIGEREVTNAEYCEFLNDEGNGTTRGVPWLGAAPHALIEQQDGRFVPKRGVERRPVVAVTWEGARAYCRWLTKRTGFRYDLPTAAQWEAAARAGTQSTWPWGNEDDPRRYHGQAQGSTDTGSYAPNAWGLHDTLGNVWEWVRDCYEHDAYDLSPLRDPVIEREDCLNPEVRGGSYRDDGRYCRPGYRTNFWAMAAAESVGFRVARYGPVKTR
ncbi:MAG TPA: SUMF1/EgtB/PvdO family nonheme iron enzyme [Thermoanaerobaculia bacterium]|nr:SUMF1/EgtB/PvdO family nonheme iron enzyme [Thermoanaerobaculia bacterium]